MLRLISLMICTLAVVCCRTHVSDSSLQSSPVTGVTAPANASANANVERPSFPQPFTFVAIEPVSTGVSSDEVAYHVVAETAPEFLCERQCSDFELAEVRQGDAVEYTAIKHPVLGKTSPSKLKADRQVRVKSAEVKRVVLHSVGKKGSDVVVQDVLTKEHPNFYASHAVIKRSLAIGGESSGFSISFAGKTLDAEIDDPKILTMLSASSDASLSGFATGFISIKQGIERGPYPVFHVRGLDTSIEPE